MSEYCPQDDLPWNRFLSQVKEDITDPEFFYFYLTESIRPLWGPTVRVVVVVSIPIDEGVLVDGRISHKKFQVVSIYDIMAKEKSIKEFQWCKVSSNCSVGKLIGKYPLEDTYRSAIMACYKELKYTGPLVWRNTEGKIHYFINCVKGVKVVNWDLAVKNFRLNDIPGTMQALGIQNTGSCSSPCAVCRGTSTLMKTCVSCPYVYCVSCLVGRAIKSGQWNNMFCLNTETEHLVWKLD